MVRGAGLIMVLGLLAGPGRATAQESYPIHLTKAGAGAVLLVEKQDSQLKQAETLDPSGKSLQNREEKQSDTIVYRETILVKPDPRSRPTHLQRQFEKAQRQTGDRTITLPFQGKSYDIEKKGGRFRFQYVGGGALPAEALPALEQEFNSGMNDELDWEKFILPAKPVRVNESWNLDVARVIRVLGRVCSMEIDGPRSVATAKLSQVYQQDNRRFAVVDAYVDLPVQAVVQGNTRRSLQPGSRITLQLRINGCIDGSAEAIAVQVNVQILSSSLVTGPHTQVTLKMNSQSTISETRREQRKR